MSSPKFQFDAWANLLPFANIPLEARSSQPITSPSHILVIEEIRRRAAALYPLGPTVPTDVFVFAEGESPNRSATKIGGLPYRSSSLPWPTAQDGTPYTFLCQFCFTDSHDIVGVLPGDVLLVFRRDEELCDDDNKFIFEWHPLDLLDLVAAAALPDPGWHFVTCYGLRHRTHDYVDRASIVRLQEFVPAQAYHAFAALGVWRLEGMKIGGAPMYLNPAHGARFADYRFLCQLSTVSPVWAFPHPWVNRAEPIEDASILEQQLIFADGFAVYFLIDDSFRIHPQVVFH